MKATRVEFKSAINIFGTAVTSVAADATREIEYDPAVGIFAIKSTSPTGPRRSVRYVPIANVAVFEAPEE